MYLAEVLGLMPGSSPFERAETLSVVSAFVDLDEKLLAASSGATVEERKTAHEKALVETVSAYLKYQERFVRGTYYFGDRVSIAYPTHDAADASTRSRTRI